MRNDLFPIVFNSQCIPVSYTHLRAHETEADLVCRLLLEKNIKIDEKLAKFFVALKNVNSKLWIIEDDKRKCENDSNFGEDFIRLSRDVHFLNDTRAKIKLDINNHTGSKIKEIKEYTSY